MNWADREPIKGVTSEHANGGRGLQSIEFVSLRLYTRIASLSPALSIKHLVSSLVDSSPQFTFRRFL